jgi:hypothetical protein
MRTALLLFVAVLLLAGVVFAVTEEQVREEIRTKRNSPANFTAGQRPQCPRIIQLPRGIDAVRRDQTAVCLVAKLDKNHDGKISADEYRTYFYSVLPGPAQTLANTLGLNPNNWNTTIMPRCDCNWDTMLTSDEIKHAYQTCLESNFYIDAVHDHVC